MSIVQVIIDRTTSMIIEGIYEFDRANGGTLLIPSGSSFPSTPAAKELFWRTDESKLYRRNDANDAWVSVVAVIAAHASSHEGGADPMTVDAAAGTGSLRTLGTSATAACAGNDSRLSDARTPTAHASTHKAGGTTDEIKLDDLAAPDDNTDLNASTEKHGLLLKLGGGSSNFLRADGSWATPPSMTVHDNTYHDPDMLTVGSSRSDANLDKLTDGDEDDDVDPLHLHVRRDKSKAYLWDDFVGNTFDGTKWASSVSGTGSSTSLLNTGIGGVLQMISGGAAARYAYFTGGTKWPWSYDKKAVMEFRFKVVDLADSYNSVGLRRSDNDRAYFYRSGSGNWFAYTVLGGASTSTDTGIPADTSWHTFQISCEAGQIVFRIDGVVKATHNTNLPTEQMEPAFLQYTSAGSATRTSHLDWVEITGDRN